MRRENDRKENSTRVNKVYVQVEAKLNIGEERFKKVREDVNEREREEIKRNINEAMKIIEGMKQEDKKRKETVVEEMKRLREEEIEYKHNKEAKEECEKAYKERMKLIEGARGVHSDEGLVRNYIEATTRT